MFAFLVFPLSEYSSAPRLILSGLDLSPKWEEGKLEELVAGASEKVILRLLRQFCKQDCRGGTRAECWMVQTLVTIGSAFQDQMSGQ